MHRRNFLKNAGAVTILVSGGQVWRVFAQAGNVIPEGPAFEPWKTWGEDSGRGPLALVRAAILSANAYNSQPGLFQVSNTHIEIFADVSRNLGAFDPYLREMHFSLGCALENLLLACGPNGYAASAELFPGALHAAASDPKPERVALVNLKAARTSANELYEAIPRRHTNRTAYDPQRPLPAEFLAELERLPSDDQQVRIFLFPAEAQRKRLVELITQATGPFNGDPEVRRGTQRWLRTSPDQMQKFRDGTLLEPGKGATLESYAGLMLRAPVFGLIGVRDRYDRPQTIRAGRVWQRAHLLATVRGVAARPANGAVELIDHQRRLNMEPRSAGQLAEVTGDASWQPTFMFYMGYAPQAAPASARRPAQDCMLS